MYRWSPYIVLYAVVILLQMFFFDNLSFDIAITPLVYVAVVLFMPFRTSQFAMLMVGAFVGISADLVMGLAGVNTISTIFLAYIRNLLITLFMARGVSEGANGTSRITYFRRVGVIFVGLLLHHTLFFILETLSFSSPLFLLCRTLLSVVVATIFVTLLYNIFTTLTLKKHQ